MQMLGLKTEDTISVQRCVQCTMTILCIIQIIDLLSLQNYFSLCYQVFNIGGKTADSYRYYITKADIIRYLYLNGLIIFIAYVQYID